MSSAKDIVENAISNRRVVIFAKSYCPHCRASKQLLKELFPPDDVLIFDLDLMEGQAIQDYLAVKTGKKTVPQTFISSLPTFTFHVDDDVYFYTDLYVDTTPTTHTDGHHIGGNDDLQEAYKNGTLQRMIDSA